MPKTETLKDGTTLTIRELSNQDLDTMMKFFTGLSADDRNYLRVDVTNRKTVEQRLTFIEFGYHFRLGAFQGDEMIGEAALELPFEEWRRHQGEIRVIVASALQRKGLGMLLMREIYCLALRKNVDMVVCWLMKPQIAAQSLCRKMGFKGETILPSYVRDQAGEMHDLVIMKAKLTDLMSEIEKYYGKIDWEHPAS